MQLNLDEFHIFGIAGGRERKLGILNIGPSSCILPCNVLLGAPGN